MVVMVVMYVVLRAARTGACLNYVRDSSIRSSIAPMCYRKYDTQSRLVQGKYSLLDYIEYS